LALVGVDGRSFDFSVMRAKWSGPYTSAVEMDDPPHAGGARPRQERA
jgi:hypothetical protein